MGNSIVSRFVVGGVCLGLFTGFGLAQKHAGAAGSAALLIVNQGDRNVSVVDPATGRQVATITENVPAVHVHEAAASPDGRTAYLPVYGSTGVGKPGLNGQTMMVVDIASQKLVGNVDFGHEVRPHCPVFDPTSGLLYVTTELDNTVTAIDPRTLKIVGTIPTGQEQSHMLAISSDGKRGYTANVGPGTVSVLDLKARKTLAIIPISKTTQRISVSRDDSMVFTSDQTEPRLAVIDTATNKVKTWVTLPGTGYGTASTRDGRWLLVAIPSKDEVAVVDLKSMKVARTIAVPKAPQEVLVRPDGKVAYVSSMVEGRVGAIDLVGWKVQDVIVAGKGADGLAWAK